MLRILSKQLIKTTMEREEMQLGEKSNLNFTNQFNLLDLSLTKQEYNLMELGSSSQRQWRYSMACPTDNQLSWLGSLKCGWSTVSAKYSARQRTASPMHNDPPRKLLAKFEVNRVNSIVSEIERFQKMDELRILMNFKKYKELKSKASGDGINTCILCGLLVAKKRQGWKTKEGRFCHDCRNQMCTKCTRSYTLKELPVKLCVLCHWKRELWKMSGAWYNGYHNAFTMTLEELTQQIKEMEEDLFGSPQQNAGVDMSEGQSDSHRKRSLVTQYSLDDMVMTPGLGHGLEGEPFQKAASRPFYVNRQLSISLPALPQISIREADEIEESEEPTDSEVDTQNKGRRRSSQLTKAYTIASDSPSENLTQLKTPRRSSNQHVDELLRKLSGASGDISLRDILVVNSQENRLPRSVARLVQYSPSTRSSWCGGTLNKDSEESESTQDEYTDAAPIQRNRHSLQEEHTNGNAKLGLPKYNSLNRLKKRAEDIFRTMSFSPVPSRETTPDMKSLIEFSMAYSREQQELRVTILRCKDLKAADSNGLSDPYVNVFLAGGDPSTKQTTSMKQATLNPEYGEEIVYQGISESFVRRNEIMFVVYDYDMVGRDDFLGAASIPIRRVKHNVEKFCLQLTDNCPDILKTPKEDYGQALVTVHYREELNSLDVEIVRSVRLRPANRKKISANPCGKVTLYNKGHPETHKKTNVNYLTLNPEFNETLQFPLDGRKIAEINLRLAIVHKSRTKKRYTQIGEASLDPLLFKSIQTGEPTQEWVQLLPALSDK